MSKAGLKEAMDSLQVNRPLKLSAKAPAFKAPITPDEIESLARNTSLDVEQSQGANSTLDDLITQGRSTSQDQSKMSNNSVSARQPTQGASVSSGDFTSQDMIRPQDQNQSQDEIKSLASNAPGVITRSSQPRRATEQDRAVIEIASTKMKLSTGFTRLPNNVLMEMVGGDLNRNEVKILLLIARMTISFNRAMVPLSKSVIERMTGIQGSAALQAVHALEHAGLIRKIPGDQYKPNQLGLVISESSEITLGEKRPPDRISSKVQIPPKGSNASQGWGENSSYIKETPETIGLRKKISLSDLPDEIHRYFSELKPRRKRETEFQAFEELRQDYSVAQIGGCLSYLLDRGLPNGGGACHSPMAYLAKAIADVLPAVEASLEKDRRSRERLRKEAEAQRLRAEDYARVAAESALMERAFCKAFPSEERQNEVLAELCRGQLFSPATHAGRISAIEGWWSGLSASERQANEK